MSIIIALIIVVLAIASIYFFKRRSEQETNYKVLFSVGLVWLPLGMATKNYTFSIIGLVFVIIGLVNKSKWKDKKSWSDLSASQKKLNLILMIILTVLLILGFVSFTLINNNLIGC